MCGVVGILSFEGNPEAFRYDIERSVELIYRRGPDDEGIWTDGRACIMGFRRLSILDLSSAGRQPMLSSDGRYALVFNGEVYNFRDIRRDLEREGVSFRSSGDAEVVLYALAQWGTEALARFNGMFALGFYDVQERLLILARDHAGIKPLYYLQTPAGLLFASQYDQILAHPWSNGRNIVPEHLSLYLQLGYIPAPFALLRGSSSIDAGAWLSVNADGHLHHGRYFKFPLFREPDLRGAEAIEAVDAAVASAVKRQLVSDVPVGVFLSGGVDSPLVAAKMCDVAGSSFPGFTIGTNGDEHDESADAATIAGELMIDHHLRHMGGSEVLAILGDVIAACGEPFDDYSMFPTLLASLLAHGHVKVVLAGDGGDELFFGYPARMKQLLRRAEPSAIRWWKRFPRAFSRHQNGNASPEREYLMMQSLVPGGWVHSLFPTCSRWPSACDLFLEREQCGEADGLAQWIRWNEFSGHLKRILLKVDRASMYHSLEVRVPLLDREVIEVACRVAWRDCIDIDRGLGKFPLRHSLARHVRFQAAAKRGFTVPMSEWLRGPLRAVFEDVVLPKNDMLGLPINSDALRRQFQAHLSGAADLGWALWRLLSLCLWEEHHLRRHGHHG